MRLWMIAAALLAAGGAAWASGYDDYMRGYEARRAGNVELALSSFTAALAASDLAPTYRPDALIGRADMLMRKRRCAEALADLDTAVSLRPNTVETLTLRAHANECVGKPDAALADLDAAIAVSPVTGLYAYRGSFHWFHGNFALAAADYLKAAQVQNKRAFEPRAGVYSLLWYAIIATRIKTFDAAAFDAVARNFENDDWPGPLMNYVRGKAKTDAIYRDAAKGEGPEPALHKCEADFFVGEWQLAGGDVAGKALLQSVVQSCTGTSNFAAFARRDLNRTP